MRFDRPPPGEELNPGEQTAPREAASTIVLRDGGDSVEVLLLRRNPSARFMGGVWVFPGGATSPRDADLAATGRRELAEEAGIDLGDGHPLVPFSRWITPAQIKIRFDTHFFVTVAPDGAEPVPDGAECVDARWMTPADALAAGAREEITLVFPTIKTLERLAGFESAAAVLADARGRPIEPIEPRVVVGDEAARVVLPGEPGYER